MDTFNHYDRSQGSVNIKAALIAISAATRGSIFIFQVCCHNPTGQDYSQDHWKQLAAAVKARNHFVFFDIAYQGFASDMETDAWPVRCFAAEGIDLLACQSFSKHMGLSPARSILVPQVLASICLLPSHHPSSFFFIHTTTSSRILLKLAAMNSTAQKTCVSTREVKKLWKLRENDVCILIPVKPIPTQTKPLLNNLMSAFEPKFRVPYQSIRSAMPVDNYLQLFLCLFSESNLALIVASTNSKANLYASTLPSLCPRPWKSLTRNELIVWIGVLFYMGRHYKTNKEDY